jgi:hypothetical protein
MLYGRKLSLDTPEPMSSHAESCGVVRTSEGAAKIGTFAAVPNTAMMSKNPNGSARPGIIRP